MCKPLRLLELLTKELITKFFCNLIESVHIFEFPLLSSVGSLIEVISKLTPSNYL